MMNLKEMINANISSEKFPLLGQTITVSPERIVYCKLKQKYDTLAQDAYERFMGYMNSFSDLTDLIDSAPTALIAALEEAINEVSSDAVSVGCYSFDAATIIADCIESNYFDTFQEVYAKYVERDYAIASKLSNAADYRAARKDSRGRWTSTTIGGTMVDAWGNQFKAASMNAIEGAGHSVRNAIGNMIDEMNADDERKKLFENTALRNELASSVYVCAINLRRVITNTVSRQCSDKLGGWVTENDYNLAKSMNNNLCNLNLDIDKKREFIVKLIELDPFNSDYYIAALKNFLENGKEILDIASFFNINNLMNAVKDIVADYARNNVGNTPEELNACREAVFKSAASLSIDADDLKNALDVINENGRQILIRIASQNIGKTEDDAYACQKMVYQLRDEMQLTEEAAHDALKIIDDKLKKLDLEYRTVDGVVLASRSVADQNRNSIGNFRETLDLPIDFKFKSQYLQHIRKLSELPLDKSITDKYINQTKIKMAEFDKRCKKAARHEYRRTHGGRPFWNGDIASMIKQYLLLGWMTCCTFRSIHDKEAAEVVIGIVLMIITAYWLFGVKTKKEEKIWNELTENGKYSFNQVTSENV